MPPSIPHPAVRSLAALLATAAFAPLSDAAPPVDSVVVFNELQYHPTDTAGVEEWLELHNQMGIDIDLSDWSITGGVNYTFADGTVIPGGGYLVVARTPGAIPGALGPWTGALSNGGETLRLRDKNRRLMDEVSYDDSGDWPVAPDGSGATLAKADEGSNSHEAANWTQSAQVGGTPGAPNFPPPPPPVSARVIEFFSDWRFNNSGTDPGATWNTSGYDDSGPDWATGTAAFDFGATTVYSNEPPGGGGDFQEITGITIEDVSSEATGSGLTRGAANCVDGSGLSGDAHGTMPDGTMWLTNGSLLAPTDPLPAYIVFDLGAVKNLTSIQVWNYNENSSSDQTARGARAVAISVAASVGGAFTPAGNFEFAKADGTAGESGENIAFAETGVRLVRFDISTNWGASNNFVGLSEVKFFSDETGPPPAPPVYRAEIDAFRATGIDASGDLLDPGDRDPHYINTADGLGAFVETAHPAWLGPDGVSQWLGPTAAGLNNVPPGQTTYRFDVDLTYWRTSTADILFYPSVDNTLDQMRVGGSVVAGVNGGGFGGYLGPYTIPNTLFTQGPNTVEFDWTNAGAADNPAGFRAKWEATAEPILARTTLAANPITTWFRKEFVWNGDPASTYQLRLEHLVDDGAVFYLNGVEVLRFNMPAGAVGPTTLAASETLYPQFSGVAEIPAAAFTPGTNLFAVELHQVGAADADALFGMTLDLTETPPAPQAAPSLSFNEVAGATAATGGFFVELANTGSASLPLDGYRVRTSGGDEYLIPASTSLPSGSLLAIDEASLGFRPADGERLFLVTPSGGAVLDAFEVRQGPRARTGDRLWQVPDGTTAGAPNSFSIPDGIVINEIMYHHMPTYLPTGSTPDPEEWVELYNHSGAPVDLTGWRLRGGADFDFLPGTSIPDGGYLVVADDAVALATKYPAITVVGPWSGGLSNAGDVVRLEDANGNTVDEVTFADGGRWDGRADGGGSSLELRHPDMDNALPEAWVASDETGKASWQTITYSGQASSPPGSNDPSNYHEFILGMLDAGEVLIDDVSVVNNSTGGTQLIQNRDFSAGNADTWRLLGNHGLHGRSTVVSDGGNQALLMTATGPTEHMHNHCETTLKNGASYVTINGGHNYTISFRAKWQSGLPRLHSRLYFNRLARQHLLAVPTDNGTPGAANSRAEALPSPALSGLAHAPVLPAASEAVTVNARLGPEVAASAVALHWRVDPSTTWNQVAMSSADGKLFEAPIPGQAAGALVQFYVTADGTNGASSQLPAAGPESRAMVRWANGIVPPGPGHGFRILLPEADTDEMHTVTQVMSNWFRPCTVVYREGEVFYDATVRLRSSQRGRFGDPRLGFAIRFDPAQKFRGVHTTVNMDRSAYGPGTTGSGFGQVDIINQQFALRAGGIPAMYNDMVYLIAPRSTHNGSAQMTMAEFNDPYLDGQWDNGADSPTFKFDLIYHPNGTIDGNPESLKRAVPDSVNAREIGQLQGTSKEDYRWHFLIGNARSQDDYDSIIALNRAFDDLASGDSSTVADAIDIDQWLRASAAMSLVNSNDSYATGGLPHNLKLYVRPEDGRVLYLPWDQDFFKRGTNFAILGNPDLQRIVNASPVWKRLFYGHLHDIIATSYNTGYLTSWVSHLEQYTTAPGDWNEIVTYVQDRANFALADCAANFPSVNFAITTNGGANFSTPNSLVSLVGDAWIDVREIRLSGNPLPLDAVWTDGDSWQLSLPVAPGANAFTLEAFNFQGELIATDSITVTGTGAVEPASAANIVISEFDYHPAPPSAGEVGAGFTEADDFEFVELMNISTSTVDLSNCFFDTGLTYTIAPGTTLPPGGRLVIPRRGAAFALRYPGVSTAPEYYVADGNVLRNSGEELSLVDASGVDIKRFEYNDKDPWPEAADGLGSSLVLIAPDSNPDHSEPLNWRAGIPNPGASDALPAPADPLGDDNNDGVSNLVDYAAGGQVVMSFDGSSVSFERETLADALIAVETSNNLVSWDPAVIADSTRMPLAASRERVIWELDVLPGELRRFVRIVVSQ